MIRTNHDWLTVSDSELEADLRQWTDAGRVPWMRPVSVLAPSWCFETHPQVTHVKMSNSLNLISRIIIADLIKQLEF